jgi:hypothetical protein
MVRSVHHRVSLVDSRLSVLNAGLSPWYPVVKRNRGSIFILLGFLRVSQSIDMMSVLKRRAGKDRKIERTGVGNSRSGY